LAGSPTQKIGYEVVSELPKKAHPKPMLSLDKTKSVAELAAFLGVQPGILSWKMDGLTVVLTYENGALAEAVTRGNGEVGEVITANARTFENLPHRIAHPGRLVLRGEAVITYEDFRKVNASLGPDEEKYKNPRNLCSGSVRQLNSQITALRHVRLYAFSLVECEGRSFALHSEEMDYLASLGFETVFYRKVDAGSVAEAVRLFAEEITDNPVPSDGLVLLMDDIAYGASLGRTAKFPRDSIAFKWADEASETTLREIEWSASRTGLINPVAVFDPVEIEGTSVSRASVHNVSILEELELGTGDRITVYKANMIIPQIAENLTRSGTCRPPAYCPVCGKPTRIAETAGTRTLVCDNPECLAKQIKRFALLVSRDALNVEGLSESNLERLTEAGFVSSFADLFRLDRFREEFVAQKGWGEKSFLNLQAALKKASRTTLPRLLAGIGIPNVGPSTAKTLTDAFGGDLAAIRAADEETLAAVRDIGPATAAAIRSFFDAPDNAKELDDLLPYLTIEKQAGETPQGGKVLEGKTLVITGSLLHFGNRKELAELIEAYGGKVSGSVSSKTAYLINNDTASTSGKNRAAKELGIPVLSEEELLTVLGVPF
ncbi:MAG: NAD-dependent DNA ligase LigA, partial [Clostridia bacterium]|nr:NAD-dependent DNA ligase LigA [Clostridia bacterium]